ERDLQSVRAGRKGRQDIRPVGLSDDTTGESRVGLRDRNGNAGQHPAALIAYGAIELRRRLTMGDATECKQPRHKQEDTPTGAHLSKPPEPIPTRNLECDRRIARVRRTVRTSHATGCQEGTAARSA